MKNRDLIKKLSQELKPVKPLGGQAKRTVSMILGMAFGAALTFALFSIRKDVHEVTTQSFFIGSGLALFMGWLATSSALAILQSPQLEGRNYLVVGWTSLALVSLGYLVSGLGSSELFLSGLSLVGVKCSLDILFLSLIPGVWAFISLRRGAPTNISLTGFIVGLSCALLGAFALQFSCPSQIPTHLLFWHLAVPITVIAGAGYFLGQKILRW